MPARLTTIHAHHTQHQEPSFHTYTPANMSFNGDANYPPGPYEVGKHIVPPPRPISPATASYRLNHLTLRIKDAQRSLRFYCDCLGMHVVFIFNAGPWTIYYLGPRDVELDTLGTSKGLLELYHIPSDDASTSTTPYASGNDYSSVPSSVGFGHVGFTVPSVEDALRRVESSGFEVIKPLEEARVEQMGLPDEVVQGRFGHVVEGYKHVFRQLAFVRDPDGYWVELVPQVVL
ncbi:lactoylglutathione lyase [Pyrenophora seminiperda CCB06]|uniref:Lactoylglutathione lyase n=1 Tax=Pyrenophora seminiperda CCB06 TaxID=1302712 RepID=A0A3M7M743_9PLEO|nr:lactoylglutathione lyase [Pyrenophora seminiperda CCB06]